MKKRLLVFTTMCLFLAAAQAQSDQFWQSSSANRGQISKDKAVMRSTFPTDFKLFELNKTAITSQLLKVTGSAPRSKATVITLPSVDGTLEQFEVYEASNFVPELQAAHPDIRAFSGKGITDKSATVKISLSPKGIQTMTFRSEKETEFIEAYSQDHKIYAVFNSSRSAGKLPWTCSTEEKVMFSDLGNQISKTNKETSNAGELRTMRLAQSCNGEYANFFGASTAGTPADEVLVLSAFNATLTRCNGVYERDLALHLNLIANTNLVIFYNPATDPYTTLGAWNGQLQNTLTNVIGEANYDIGHMFGASGGGGNAGCIGCVCNNSKGSGITSPADGIPAGDNFDIDFVAHEVGHQLGGNHTFSMSNEGSGVNKEVGSGITIMGYAGITSQDVARHSIDIFHETSINQIQINLAAKTCPVLVNIAGTNATPVVAPVAARTIPISTPFVLTGTATDANAGDVLSYNWEQNDNALGSQTGGNSVASPAKLTGPNWLSFPSTPTGVRTMPRLATILAGQNVTGPLPGGDAGANIEALSSVGRVLNFRLTVRDNALYKSAAPQSIGQTQFTDVAITVLGTAGPFEVTAPNTNVSWDAGSTQTVTWSVNNTDQAPISCANVKISMSTDGGLTFPVVLAASTANDGSENLVIPAPVTATARIKIESIGNIFFDISNTNFTVATPPSTFNFGSPVAIMITCGGSNVATSAITTSSLNGYAFPITLTATGLPAGVTASFAPNPVVPGNAAVASFTGVNSLASGTYSFTVTGTSGAIVKTIVIPVTVNTTPITITTPPAAQSVCVPVSSTATFTVVAAGTVPSYQWQVSTDNGTTYTNIAGATSASYTATGITAASDGNLYRVAVAGLCSPTAIFSAPAKLTVNIQVAITAQPAPVKTCNGETATFSVAATGSSIMYQWQVSINGGPYINLANGGQYSGVTTPTLTVNNLGVDMSGYMYRVVVSNVTCGAINSIPVALTVNQKPTVILSLESSTAITPYVRTTLRAIVSPASTSYSYMWYKNGVLQPSLSGSAIPVTVDDLGEYYVVVTNTSTTCGTTSNKVTVTEAASDILFVYPNPSNGQFQVRYYNAGGASVDRTVMVFDSKGAKVFSKQFAAVTGPYGKMDVNLKVVETGTYHVVVVSGSGKQLAASSIVVKSKL